MAYEAVDDMIQNSGPDDSDFELDTDDEEEWQALRADFQHVSICHTCALDPAPHVDDANNRARL